MAKFKKIEAENEKSIKVAFGLVAQGHIPTIETIIKKYSDEEVDFTYEKWIWEKIGKEIGWCPFTAALAYFKYLSKQSKAIKQDD